MSDGGDPRGTDGDWFVGTLTDRQDALWVELLAFLDSVATDQGMTADDMVAVLHHGIRHLTGKNVASGAIYRHPIRIKDEGNDGR